MPKVEKESTNDNQEVTNIPVDTLEAPAEVDDKHDHRKTASPLTVVSVVLVFFLALFAVGGVFMFLRGNMMERRYSPVVNLQESMPRMRTMYVREVSNTTTDSTSQSIASGVVTSVNGSSFVIGGNGTKVTVNTSGNTTWNTTDKKVSVNDSLVVIGTESNGTITATSVRIANL
jgi:hypothetical protein